jgi:glycosyltransferase involved in cell wall biosynthesis
LVKKWRVDEDKIIVLPNAADTDLFGGPFDVRSVRYGLGLNDEPVVMFVGGFYLWHDLGLLVQSFSDVLKKVPNARLVLVGDGRTRPMVDQLVEENGLTHAVLMTGPVEHRQIPEMLAVASVAVAPNISFFNGHGGSPLKIYEYMAAGKAIVATRTGQIAEVIQDERNGILVEAGNRDELAEAMIRLLKDSHFREQLGREARRQAVEYHSWTQYARQLEEIYSAIL